MHKENDDCHGKNPPHKTHSDQHPHIRTAYRKILPLVRGAEKKSEQKKPIQIRFGLWCFFKVGDAKIRLQWKLYMQ